MCGITSAWTVCLLLGAFPVPKDAAETPPKPLREGEVEFNSRKMDIPINYNRRDELAQLHLYVSTDDGKTWTKLQSTTPAFDKFVVELPSDGSYAFVMQLVSKDGTVEPKEMKNVQPALRLRVTTKKAPDTRRVVAKPEQTVPTRAEKIQRVRKELQKLDSELREIEKADLREEIDRVRKLKTDDARNQLGHLLKRLDQLEKPTHSVSRPPYPIVSPPPR